MASLLEPLKTSISDMQGLMQSRQNMNIQAQQEARAQQQYEAQLAQQQAAAEQQAAYNELIRQYQQTNDPALIRQAIAMNPESTKQIVDQWGVVDDNQKNQIINTGAALSQLIRSNPEQAKQAFETQLANIPAFAGLADNFANGDYEGALNEIGFGITALGGMDAYDSLFGEQEKTSFTKDLIAAGIEPGSQEFKDAVLDKYGKGDTIGYDVIEGVNPDTGRNEYYQVSRVNPSEKIALGIAVPQTAAEIKRQVAEQDAATQEADTITNTLSTVSKLLNSPGLSGFSGLDAFRSFIPGTEAANVRAWIEQLQSQNFLTSVSQMKGMGALSENEGKKLSSAVAALDRSMSDEAIKAELMTIQENLLKAAERIESNTLIKTRRDEMQADNQRPASTGGTVRWEDL